MTPMRATLFAIVVLTARAAWAHSGPPFPIVEDRVAGAYRLAIWTDPDTTDDGSAAGQFWVRIAMADTKRPVPAATHASVTVTSAETGRTVSGMATPVAGDLTNQFAVVNLDREGRFAVHVTVDGPAGSAAVESAVDATYDLRPPAFLLAVYAMPFLLIGYLWLRALRRRPAR